MQGKMPLCGISISNQLVVGCQDGSLIVTSHEGLHIATLNNHKASVCCLAILKMKGQ